MRTGQRRILQGTVPASQPRSSALLPARYLQRHARNRALREPKTRRDAQGPRTRRCRVFPLKRLERYKVDFPVFLAWQDRQGLARRVTGRCTDLSESGAHVETKEQFAPHTMVVLTS